jgi:hypothetical protein
MLESLKALRLNGLKIISLSRFLAFQLSCLLTMS